MRGLLILGSILLVFEGSCQVNNNFYRLLEIAHSRKQELELELKNSYYKSCTQSQIDSIKFVLTVYSLRVPNSKVSFSSDEESLFCLEYGDGTKVMKDTRFLNDVEFIELKRSQLFKKKKYYLKSESFLFNNLKKIIAISDEQLNFFCASDYNKVNAFIRQEELFALFEKYKVEFAFQISGEKGTIYFGLSKLDLWVFEMTPNKIQVNKVKNIL